MSNIIEGAKPSPRIRHGVIYWYAGDVFSLPLKINLKDENGYGKTILEDESVVAVFYNASNSEIWRKGFSDISDNTIVLEIGEAETEYFAKEGIYRMKIYLESANGLYTIADDIEIIIE